MSHIWMNHIAHVNESRHTYERVMSHTWMRHVTHTDESCHTYEWVMSYIRKSRCVIHDGVATIGRLLKIIGFFCRIWSLLLGSFAKETYNFKEPTDRSQPIYSFLLKMPGLVWVALQHTATHCDTLQHTATHCNTLQHTATHCDTLRHTATHCDTLRHIVTHCVTLPPCSAIRRIPQKSVLYFSKVCFVVILHSELRSVLTFENFRLQSWLLRNSVKRFVEFLRHQLCISQKSASEVNLHSEFRSDLPFENSRIQSWLLRNSYEFIEFLNAKFSVYASQWQLLPQWGDF